MDCSNCNGKGLVSTGAVPTNLEVGNKITCPECGGTGQIVDVPTPAPIMPKVGALCLTETNQPGTLQATQNGFVCVADEIPEAPKVESPSLVG